MRLLALLVFLSILPGLAAADEPLAVQNAYAYATTSVQKNGAVFFSAKNLVPKNASGAANGIKITKAEADVAERVELHTHAMDGDMMMMREIGFFEVPPDGTLTLEPMGDHIMLMGLKAPLQAGESFPLTLYTGDGHRHAYGSMTVDVKIVNPGDAP